MSVSSEITRLYGVRSDIFDAITAKGVTVPQGSMLDDVPGLIGQISGGDEPVPVMPDDTYRVEFSEGYTPTTSYRWTSVTQVSSSPNVWDIQVSRSAYPSCFGNERLLLKVIAAGRPSSSSLVNMFSGCSALQSVALFDTSAVTSMENMFFYCNALHEVPLFNTSAVTDMYGMFEGCGALHTVPLFNTSSVHSMSYMFNYCTALLTVPLFDMSSVGSMFGMFSGCESLRSVPLFDTSSATDMNNMFNGCSALRTIPLFDTRSVVNVDYMFSGCTNVESGALALYQQMSSQVTPPTAHDNCFYECGSSTTTGAEELAQIPSDWKGM